MELYKLENNLIVVGEEIIFNSGLGCLACLNGTKVYQVITEIEGLVALVNKLGYMYLNVFINSSVNGTTKVAVNHLDKIVEHFENEQCGICPEIRGVKWHSCMGSGFFVEDK